MALQSSVSSEHSLRNEMGMKWVLNWQMPFLDKSEQEKFFFVFVETPNRWRRVTVSCDYRQPDQNSLEYSLKSEADAQKRGKMIYEAIQDTLPQLQLFDTVTNLKLKTSEGILNIHVTEDANEAIRYPSLLAVEHLHCKNIQESDVEFYSHASSFVYQVLVEDKLYIKKEIPGPGAVEQFLREMNALIALEGSNHVIKLEGIIVDQVNQSIKGLLINNADQGALVDLLKNYKNSDRIQWACRERWARQIIEGLSEIHAEGLVHGNLTLSNIVIDRDDNAKIIDFSRHVCSIGWEPPEITPLIMMGHPISTYIGVESDLFQLGMVLWALVEQYDKPEHLPRPLSVSWSRDNAAPRYLRELVRRCLSESPEDRPSAKDILWETTKETS